MNAASVQLRARLEDLIERIKPAPVGIAIRPEVGGAFLNYSAGLVEIKQRRIFGVERDERCKAPLQSSEQGPVICEELAPARVDQRRLASCVT